MASSSPKNAAMPQASERRVPRQKRSEQTIETIFEAVAHVLEREGESAVNTNHIAAVAGFSVGTLYQYFPNKEVLLRAMSDQMLQRVLARVEKFLNELSQRDNVPERSAQVLVAEAVSHIVDALTLEGRHQRLLRLFWKLEQPEQTEQAVQRVSELLRFFLEQGRHPELQMPQSAELYVLTRAVLGVMRSASLEQSPLLSSPKLKDALTRLVMGMLSHSHKSAP